MRAGKRRHRVTIEQNTGATVNALNERVAAWSELTTVWAAVEPITARERLRSPEVVAGLTHRVTMPYVAGITSAMRVKFGARYLYCNGPPIDTEERHRELVLLCEEREDG